MALSPAFWAGRRVFLTGHTGFKGSWLAILLRELGADVSGYSLPPPTEPSLFAQARLADLIPTTFADIRDAVRLEGALHAARPEIVIHLAAQSLVRRSYADPIETYSTNVLGTAHVLEALRKVAEVRVALVVTSDKCYENRGIDRGYREDDALGGSDPYSSSKACAELVTTAYARSFLGDRGVAVASVRAGNVIGGGDWSTDRLVPDVIAAFRAGRPVEIRYPNAVRPWQHVLDPLGGYLLLAQRLWNDRALQGAWNFGPEDQDARPVSWVVERLASLWGDGVTWTRAAGAHPAEAALLRVDASRARRDLGWRSRVPLEDALAGIVAWHRPVAAGDPRERTLAEIRGYLGGTR